MTRNTTGILAVVFFSACSSGGGGADEDTAQDTSSADGDSDTDTDTDADTDTDSDSDSDTDTDTGPDTDTVDTATDTQVTDTDSASDDSSDTTDTSDTATDTQDTDTSGVVIGQWTTIPAGSFWMGTPEGTCPEGYTGMCTSEPGRASREMLHYVQFTNSFEIMPTEVTEGDFAVVMGWNPAAKYDASCSYGCGVEHPVIYVSWWDNVAYANELSLDEGFSPCYALTNVVCEDATNVGTDYLSCMNDTRGGN